MTTLRTNREFHHLLLETDGIGGDADKFYTSTIDEEYGNLISESGSELYHLPDAQHATNALLDENGEVVARFKYQAFGQAHSASDGSLSTGRGNDSFGRVERRSLS